MPIKRNGFWFAALVTVSGFIPLYISVRNKKRMTPLPLYAGERGTVSVSAASLEQTVYQLLSEERNVRPLRIRAVFKGQSVQRITGTLQLKQSRFTPSIKELEEKIHWAVREQFGIELPATALHFETILTEVSPRFT